MQRVNEHCCDSRGVKPDIRHPDLTCLPIHHRLSFLSVLLLPLIPPPLLLDSPALSSPHLAPLPFHDHPSLSGIALRGRELCGWNMAAAPRAHASGTPVTSSVSRLLLSYIFLSAEGATALENLTPFPPELLPRICPIFCPFLLFNLFQSQVKFLFF